MKILFLHISDTHFLENTNFRDINIYAMVDALDKIEKFDKCILIYSGDVAQSGKKEQFNVAGNFLGILLKRICKKYLNNEYIETYIVPGNHDNLIKNPKRTNLDINKIYDDNIVEQEFYNELAQLKDFDEFAKRNKCCFGNNAIVVKTKDFGDFRLRINLINTAPFSILGSGNEDKGIHYLPKKELNKLKDNFEENYTISIMHHSPEWFSDSSKHSLYDKLYNKSDLIFIGHEHYPLNENKQINGQDKNINISTGLALYGTDTKQGFNAVILDIDKKNLTGYKFIYSNNEYLKEIAINKTNVIFKNKYDFIFNNDFKNELKQDPNDSERIYYDYFVFPSLKVKNMGSNINQYTVANDDDFMEIFKEKSKIIIEGDTKTGKTVLSKYICYILSQNYVVIYADKNVFSLKKPAKILKDILVNQYKENIDYDKLKKVEKKEKVLIVDDYNEIDKKVWKNFCNEYEEEFGHIILFSDINWNIDLKEKTIEELTDTEFYCLKICPFYYTKRETLINKIYMTLKKDNKNEIKETVKLINDDITKQLKYFQLTPDFIYQFVELYLNYPFLKKETDTNVLNKVFEANIVMKLSKYVEDRNDIDEILVVLGFIANNIHLRRTSILSYDDFKNIINEYKTEFDNDRLSVRYVFDVTTKANILQTDKNEFCLRFKNKNLLAYFIAQHLNIMLNRGECIDEFKSLLENICFGINGDIILFLSYIKSNTKLLMSLIKEIKKHMESWEDLDLDTNNIEYLSKAYLDFKLKIPTKEDKEQYRKRKNEIEKEIKEQIDSEDEDIYDYDESKSDLFVNKMLTSMKYLDIISKILPTFRHILKKEEKQEVVSILYSYPNKLLYFILKNIDKNYNEIVKEILNANIKTKEGLLITEDIVCKALQNQSIGYILSIYDFIMSTAVTNKTIGDFKKFEYEKKITYQIQYLLALENIADFNRFYEHLTTFYKDDLMMVIKQMIQLIVRKYFICHDIKMQGKARSCADKFFGEESRKQLQLIKSKNKIIKK